jgi:DNA-binding NarL/FixJ family response regulator
MAKIRVLIADDHLVVREGLDAMLRSSDEFEIVGQAVDGLEALRLAEELRPDVVLIDVQMPKMDGIEATRRITQQVPATQVVILSSFDQDEYIFKAIQAGARGYLLKDIELHALLDVVRAAAQGESALPPAIATKLMEHISARHTQVSLTRREQEVLSLLAKGLRNKEIAGRLNIAERTVKSHVANIIAKLGVSSRTEAVSQALKEGRVRLD